MFTYHPLLFYFFILDTLYKIDSCLKILKSRKKCINQTRMTDFYYFVELNFTDYAQIRKSKFHKNVFRK